MYDLYHGLQLWKKQKLTITILFIGFISFIGLLYITLLATLTVFDKTPSWVGNDLNFATIGIHGNDGSLKPTSLEKLTPLLSIHTILQHEYVGKFTDSEFLFNDKNIKLPVYFYSPNLFKFLGIKGFEKVKVADNTAIVNNAFIQQYVTNKGQLSGYIKKKNHTKAYQIFKHNLPREFSLLGNKDKPAIWLPIDAVKEILNVNFKTPIPEEQLAKIKSVLAKQSPFFYAIAEINKYSTLATQKLLHNFISEKATKNSELTVTILNNKSDLFIVDGVDFYPEQTKVLRQIAKLGLFLTLLLGFSVLLNFFSYNLSNAIRRKAEFDTRISIGATKKNIILQLIKEQLPLTILLIVAVLLILTLIDSFLLTRFAQYFVQYPNIQILCIFISLFFLVFIILLGVIIPFSSISTKHFFSRSKSKTLTQGQQLLLRLNSSSQMVTALIFISISSLMIYNYLQQKQSFHFNFNLYQTQLTSNGNSLAWHNIRAALTHELGDKSEKVALISSAILEPNNVTLDASIHSTQSINRHPIMTLFVSPTFFKLLDVKIPSLNKNNSFIFLNIAAKKTLGMKKGGNRLLYIKDNFLEHIAHNKPIQITGFINDIPHFGLGKSSPAMAYIDYHYNPVLLSNTITLLYPPSIKDTIAIFIDKLQKNSGKSLMVKKLGLINNQFDQLNAKHNLLLTGVFVFTLFICFMVGLAIYSLIQTDFYANRVKYGVWRATGISWNLLYLKILSPVLGAFLFASVVWLAIFQGIDNWLINLLQIANVKNTVLIFSFTFALCIILSALIIPFIQSKRLSIATMLKDLSE